MVKLKPFLPYVPGAVAALVSGGLQVSGYTSIPLALALWGLAGVLVAGAAIYSLKEKGWATWHASEANVGQCQWLSC